MDEYDNNLFYPQKPLLEEKNEKSSWWNTVISLLLFILTFAYFFNDQLSFIAILVVALLIHEFGHFLLMKLFGYESVSMMFVPMMGAFVNGKKKKYSQFESLLVVAGGPFPGMIIGFIFLLLHASNPNELYFLTSLIFLALNSVNLLPLDPLDGGQLLRLLLANQSDLFMFIFSLFSSLVLIFLGFLLDNWYLMGFGFFLAIRVRSSQKRYFMRKRFREKNINYIIDYNDLSNKEYSILKDIVLEDSKLLRKIKEMDEKEESQSIIANQVNYYLVAPMLNDAHLLLKVGIILFWIASFILPLYYLLIINPFYIDYGVLYR
jgi:stage IV sporulation protein FB